ncbi:MAG: ribonuclease P protein component [Thiotrichales bacterium]|nr:ribonuclease P protein component [Thiotrichales bacterium]
MVHTETTSDGLNCAVMPIPLARPSAPSPCLSDQTFDKALRLLNAKDFSYVFADAERFANRNWTLIVRANDKPYPRLGLAIAKKQLAKAVWRNRVKRVAREAFRSHKKALSGYDIVVLGRRGMEQIESQVLHDSFLHLIRKIHKSNLKHRPE